MPDVIEETVEMVRQKEAELIELKRAVNTFCSMKGLPARYDDSELRLSSGAGAMREDQFYGKQLATAVREYLQMRRHAVPSAEIVSALERGGFDFDALDWKEQYRERSLINSLVKNPKYFHRLPNGTFGLPEFYPNLPKREKSDRADAPQQADATSDDAEATETASDSEQKRTRKTKPPAPAGADGAAS